MSDYVTINGMEITTCDQIFVDCWTNAITIAVRNWKGETVSVLVDGQMARKLADVLLAFADKIDSKEEMS